MLSSISYGSHSFFLILGTKLHEFRKHTQKTNMHIEGKFKKNERLSYRRAYKCFSTVCSIFFFSCVNLISVPPTAGDRVPDSGVRSGPLSAADRATPTSLLRHAPGENTSTALAYPTAHNTKSAVLALHASAADLLKCKAGVNIRIFSPLLTSVWFYQVVEKLYYYWVLNFHLILKTLGVIYLC